MSSGAWQGETPVEVLSYPLPQGWLFLLSLFWLNICLCKLLNKDRAAVVTWREGNLRESLRNFQPPLRLLQVCNLCVQLLTLLHPAQPE